METSLSPRMVLLVAHRIGDEVLREYSCKCSRHDFTLPQLFACLVLREFYDLSYRRTEALLRDSQAWLEEIGLQAAPDHNTLWRAFPVILKASRCEKMLDLFAAQFRERGLLKCSGKPLTMDSTCFEQRHRSAHYDRRCRKMEAKEKTEEGKTADKPGKWGASVNRKRRGKVSRLPKLSLAVASSCHLILAMKVRLGNGSDAPDFKPLLEQSRQRAKVKTAVADSGYDSEKNHRISREDNGVRSIIPPGIGRPTKKLPTGRWRRHMAKRFAEKADQKLYAQRSQSETVNSMIKRNQGSALRSRTPARQKQEMMLRAITHNIALLCTAMKED